MCGTVGVYFLVPSQPVWLCDGAWLWPGESTPCPHSGTQPPSVHSFGPGCRLRSASPRGNIQDGRSCGRLGARTAGSTRDSTHVPAVRTRAVAPPHMRESPECSRAEPRAERKRVWPTDSTDSATKCFGGRIILGPHNWSHMEEGELPGSHQAAWGGCVRGVHRRHRLSERHGLF